MRKCTKPCHDKGGISRPINIMTAFDQLFTTISYSLWLIILILVATWEKPLATRPTEVVVCQSAQVIIGFGVFYSFLAGAGAAFMRLKYVTYTSRPTGEKEMTAAIVAVTMASALILTLLWDKAPKRTQTLESMCKGMSNYSILIFENIKS